MEPFLLEAQRALCGLYRTQSAPLIARLARMLRDVATAEEIFQDTLLAALQHWAVDGVPDHPSGWLMATAQRRAIDVLRRNGRRARRAPVIEELQVRVDEEPRCEPAIGDELLCLLFATCHPRLPPDARVALTLRMFGGLTTEEIARAFFAPEPTIAQRIVRAKRVLARDRDVLTLPCPADVAARLASVLEVVYLVFNEGYAATSGDDWIRPSLCAEALRLANLLVALAPAEPDAHALLALFELQMSRTLARLDDSGEPIPLLEQDRSLWDFAAIERGLRSLDRANTVARASVAARQGRLDPCVASTYVAQAEIAACHARASVAEDTDWRRIAELYRVVARCAPSAVVELNRAIAVSMVDGPDAGLTIVDRLRRARSLPNYPLVPAVRADLLYRLCRFDEAAAELRQAAALATNARQRQHLLLRASELLTMS